MTIFSLKKTVETCEMRYTSVWSAKLDICTFIVAAYDCVSLFLIPNPMSLPPVLSNRILAKSSI